MRGRGGMKAVESYRLVDVVKSERMFSGVSPVDALLYFSCFVNERSSTVCSLLFVGIARSEKKSFATRRLRKKNSFQILQSKSSFSIGCPTQVSFQLKFSLS